MATEAQREHRGNTRTKTRTLETKGAALRAKRRIEVRLYSRLPGHLGRWPLQQPEQHDNRSVALFPGRFDVDKEFFRRSVDAGEFVAGEFTLRQEFGDVAQSEFRRAHIEFEAVDERIVFPLAGFNDRRRK